MIAIKTMNTFWRGSMRDDLVVIIDSGIDVNNHEIMEHVEGGFQLNFKDGCISRNTDIRDCFGHGTNCADYILHLNPTSQFYVIKIINENGLSYSCLMLEALKSCLDVPAKIICMSLSIITKTCEIETDLHQICRRLYEQGKIICISENNEMKHSQPARFKEVIGVRADYGMKKNKLIIDEKLDIQVIADGTPVFLRGKNGEYNFFKGCSKANAFVSGAISQQQKNQSVENMESALTALKKIAKNNQEKETIADIDYGIGNIPKTDLDCKLEDLILSAIEKIGEKKPVRETFRKSPIMSQINGISYFNFYRFLLYLYNKLAISDEDFRAINVYDICTAYRLREFLKKRLKNETEKQNSRITNAI